MWCEIAAASSAYFCINPNQLPNLHPSILRHALLASPSILNGYTALEGDLLSANFFLLTVNYEKIELYLFWTGLPTVKHAPILSYTK